MNPNSIEYIAELRELLSAAHEFEKNSVKWPTLDNRLEFFANSGAGELSIVDSAKSARILVHPKVRTLATNFLECKRKHGSKKEKQLYCEMSTDTFLRRLIVQRPLVFMTEDDITLLRDGTPGVSQDWNVVGLDNERTIKITDYLTYDEMAVAALLGHNMKEQVS
ncbi:hypothetical protein K7432_012531 [Basidiobolus ranarum]|uniref:Uncharacterized protein n=1 Tax=Basidiobolus ranarum TaxID=34480 RepID=A0ABR2WKR8_9FUNG